MTECSEISSLQKDKALDRRNSFAEIKKCSKCLKNNKTGDNDGLVGELFKYGGKKTSNLLKVLSIITPGCVRSSVRLSVRAYV